jgi:hypothetical protein
MIPFRTLAIAAMLLLSVACESGEAVIVVQNTAEVIRTPAPTPSVPSIMKRIGKAGRISEVSATQLGLGDSKALPASLTQGNDRLSASVVQQIWTDWLSNSKHLIIDKGYSVYEEYCGDRTRNVLFPGTEPDDDPASYRWGVEMRAGSRWNVGTLIYDTDRTPTPDVFATPTRTLLDPSHVSESGNLLQSGEEVELLFFEGGDCGS